MGRGGREGKGGGEREGGREREGGDTFISSLLSHLYINLDKKLSTCKLSHPIVTTITPHSHTTLTSHPHLHHPPNVSDVRAGVRHSVVTLRLACEGAPQVHGP